MKSSHDTLRGWGITFATLGLLVLLFPFLKDNPVFARIFPFGLVIIGIAILVAVATTAEKYKDISDFEKTQFMGRDTNGKQVRSLIYGVGTIGCMSIVIGGFLIFFVGLAVTNFGK